VRTAQGNEAAAPAGGRGYLRTSHDEREQVVDVLKAAFVEGRLSRDELDVRVGQALASKTNAELAPLTADIPGAQVNADPRPTPPRVPARPFMSRAAGAVIAAGVASVAVLAAGVATHARLNPDVMACQSFYLWDNSRIAGPNTTIPLDFSLAAASQGSDRPLTADLQALRQAVLQSETPAGSATQVNQSSVAAAIARVNAACVPYNH
jgi:hypothetical protein